MVINNYVIMRKIFLITAIVCCISILSAQDKSDFIGEYIVTEKCVETRYEEELDKYSYNIEITSSENDKLILDKIHAQFVAQANMFKADSFKIEKQVFLAYDSSEIVIRGAGHLYGDSISIFYYAGGDFGSVSCECKGIRKNSTNIKQTKTTDTSIFQNTPNPFSNETEIKYYMPENADNACIYVFSLNGNLLLTKPITQMGNGSIVISNSELEAGMYIYTLAVGGVEVDSRRMVLTNE